MFLSSWRKLVQKVRRHGDAVRRGQRQPSETRKSRWLWVEELEELTLLTASVWNPTVAFQGQFQWSNGANWVGGTAPPDGGSDTLALLILDMGLGGWTTTNDLGNFQLNSLTICAGHWHCQPVC